MIVHARRRDSVFQLCFLRGYTKAQAADRLGVSLAQAFNLYNEALAEFGERTQSRFKTTPEQMLARRLEQLADLRQEAWDAWERSKLDSEVNTEESALRTVYSDSVGEDGRQIPIGQRMTVIRAIQKIEGRNPDSAYLRTVIQCLIEESRLEGLIEERITQVINGNVTQVNLQVNWDELVRKPAMIDWVEAKIADPTKMLPPPNPNGEWSDAEAAEMDDDKPHLNGGLNGDAV